MAQLATRAFIPSDGLIDSNPRMDAQPTGDVLRLEWLAWRRAFEDQPTTTQELFRTQAAGIADALLAARKTIAFSLPAKVLFRADPASPLSALDVPAGFQLQTINEGPLGWRPQDLRAVFRRRLSQLDRSTYPGVAYASGLLRFAFADQLIERLASGGLSSHAAVADNSEWIAFRDGRLVLSSESEAEERIIAMQRYLSALALAISLAPYFYTSEAYQSRRMGMLALLVDQGRSLAEYQVGRLIQKLRRWSAEHRLDRGLSLSVPYFDDQTLAMKLYSFEVIPAGRTPFVPAFLVLALERELISLQESQAYLEDTRIHLLSLLTALRREFLPLPADPKMEKGIA